MFEELREITIEAPIKHIGFESLRPKTTLDKLYQKGWWITEIFGSYANIVKVSECTTRKSNLPYFICVSLQIDTTKLTKAAIKTINRIKKQQWKKYEKQLTSSQYG
ncbi:MAG: hypothetical protein J6S67_23300 [Methanobrevibacter sp.]|nr:hypothetical protein [Methanobrevibacter sp.]